VMAGWDIVKPVQVYWQQQGQNQLSTYAAGSDGPQASEDMLAQSGRSWRPLI